MSTEIETELRTAFEESSAAVTPRPDLLHRVRRAHRRRRLAQLGGSGLLVVVVAVSYLVAQSRPAHRGQPPAQPDRPTAIARVPVSGGVAALAVNGSRLYVATDEPALAEYDRSSGGLLHRVPVPAQPSALAIGPDGSVWLTFHPDQNGGSTGVWRLSPDLVRRSTLDLDTPDRGAPFDVLPISAEAAELATSSGLALIELPPPGLRKDATFTRQGVRATTYKPVLLAPVGEQLAVLEQTNAGLSRIVTADQPGRQFVPDKSATITSMAGSPEGLWLTTRTPDPQQQKSLVRLDDRLRRLDPGPVFAGPGAAPPTAVWTHDRTVWVAADSDGSPLVCFVFDPDRPVTSSVIHTESIPGVLAATTDAVYLTDSRGVTGYRVPANCR